MLRTLKYIKINVHLRSVLKHEFCRICGTNNKYYSFTGPQKRVALHDDIEGNRLWRKLNILNYSTYNEIVTS